MPNAEPLPCPCCGYTQPAAVCAVCGGSVRSAPRGPTIEPGRGFWPLDLAHGFTAFWRAALQVMTKPHFFGRIGGGMMANLAAVGVLGTATWLWLWHVLRDMSTPLADVAVPLGFAPSVRLIVWLVLVAQLLGAALVQVLTVPFLDSIADAAEQPLLRRRTPDPDLPVGAGFVANARGSARIIAFQLIALLPCLALALSAIGFVVASLLAAFLSGALWLELPFGRRGYPVPQRLRLAARNWARVTGLGLGCGLGLFVPFFNLLLLAPTAAAAATIVCFHLDKSLAPTAARQ